MQSSRGETPRRGSRYPSAARSVDMSVLEMQQWAVVHDLVDTYRRCPSPNTYLNRRPPLDLGLIGHIEEESRRASCDRRDRFYLQYIAPNFVQWAMERTPVRNPIVLAKFGVEMAYQATCRGRVQYTLGDLWVRRWRWRWTARRGRPWLSWYPTEDGSRLPLPLGRFDDLRRATDKYGGDELPGDNVVVPFAGMKPSYPWVMDPMRPPVAAVRAAALRSLNRHWNLCFSPSLGGSPR